MSARNGLHGLITPADVVQQLGLKSRVILEPQSNRYNLLHGYSQMVVSDVVKTLEYENNVLTMVKYYLNSAWADCFLEMRSTQRTHDQNP